MTKHIVITGATGAVGRRAVRELLGDGHRVTGVTRSARGVRLLEGLGARAVVADVFDAGALTRAFAGADAVVNLLTHIPHGDLEGLLEILDPDVVWTADGGGRAVASRRPLHGAGKVARGWVALRRAAAIEAEPAPVEINGRLGLLIEGTDGYSSAMSFVVDGGRIARIDVVRNPEKLRRLSPSPPA